MKQNDKIWQLNFINIDKDFFMKSLHFPFALKLFANRHTDKHSFGTCIIGTDNLFQMLFSNQYHTSHNNIVLTCPYE